MNGLASGLYSGDRMFDATNNPWVDWSEQATYSGWTAFTTKYVYYKMLGSMMFIMYDIIGTSSGAGSPSFTLPFISTAALTTYHLLFTTDNTLNQVGIGSLPSTSNTVSFQRQPNSTLTVQNGAWINFVGTAGQSRIIRGQFFYEIA